MARRKIHLSYSSITTYKDCPTRFLGKYLLGVRKEEQTASQSRGTNWHDLQEVVHMKPGDVCAQCVTRDKSFPDVDCPVCLGNGFLEGDAMDASIRVLDKAFTGNVPVGTTKEDIQTLRAKLLYSLSGYSWHWGIEDNESDYEVIATEVPFKLDLLNPETSHACRDALLVGKIDKIVRFKDGRIGQVEHKSTAKPIDNDSMFWNHLVMDTQTTLYPYAMYRMQMQGELEKYGIKPYDDLATTVLYDVWHTSATKMKKLSFADTRKFVKTGEYCGREFEILGADVVKGGKSGKKEMLCVDSPTVNGHQVTCVDGKSEGDVNFIETEAMFGERVLDAIVQDPHKYFNRRDIERSHDDLVRFEGQMYSIYQCILNMRKTGFWYQCEHQCDSKYRCDFVDYCWHGEELSADNLLEGFECIFEKGKDDD